MEDFSKEDAAIIDFNKYIKKYKEIARIEKLNKRNNPIMDKRLLNFDVQETVILLKENKIEEAFKSINLNGIGPKIKSYFLRDMSILYNLKLPNLIEEQLYMFPIDLWVRNFIEGLEIEKMKEYPKVKKYADYNLSKKDRISGFNILNYCKNNNLDFRKVNVGIWFFCANVIDSTGRLSALLKTGNVENLKKEYDLRFRFDSIK